MRRKFAGGPHLKSKEKEYCCFRCITALPALVFSVYCVQKYHT
jgi:hypothetical protein